MAMAAVAATPAQETRPRTEISEQESLHLTKNLLRIAVSSISYIRGFFPENFYREKYVPALEMKVKKQLPMDMESKRFIDWIEKGVFDALEKKYLRTLFLTICCGEDGPVVEEYTFSFMYAAEGALENITSMIIESSNGKPVHTGTSIPTSPQQMKQSACKMVRTLVQLMYTLDNLPKERTIFMRLHYYDDVTPEDYEPPYFASSTNEDPNPWDHEPLKMKVGHVDGKHYKLAIKVKSVLDPCDDENDLGEDGTCVGDLMLTSDDDSSTISEGTVVNITPNQPCSQRSQPSQKIQNVIPRMGSTRKASESKEPFQATIEEATLANKVNQMQSAPKAANNSDTDQADHPDVKDESTLRSGSRLQKSEEITPYLSNTKSNEFPELLKMESGCPVVELNIGPRSNDTQQHCKLKRKSPLTNAKKRKLSEAANISDDIEVDDKKQRLYEMALLHTLPREYITMKQLKAALVDVSPVHLVKLVSQMSRDGYIENTPKVRSKGRQVFHTPEADKKLQELLAFSESKTRTNTKSEDKGDFSQPRPEDQFPTNETCLIHSNINKNEESKNLDDSNCCRMEALRCDSTRKDLRIQQDPSPDTNGNAKAIPTFQPEPPVPPEVQQKRAKASSLLEQPNVTPSTMGVKRKCVTFVDLDSPEDIDHHLKVTKVDGAIYPSLFKRANVEKFVSVQKVNHNSVTRDDPYHFDKGLLDKSPKRKVWGNPIPYHSSIDSLEEWPTLGPYRNCSSLDKSDEQPDEQSETLKSREKTRISFLHRALGTAHKKRLRPKVYNRRTRAA